ncbi:MAG: Aspartyl/glutamyl-tRNA(Asn/Gln) amidotransferase subunit B [candidate division WWE3 bacterium GW2011_GWB1_44_4]|nr:MAG: Aspartyl/glutamyl-tRNA(Asn/Gln) amidotransferase subunit B [candidate division WWE3 bacterium GW2011_GWB1_44_4]
MLTNDPVGTANVLINKAGLRTSSSEDLAKEVVQKRSSHTLTVSELTEVVSKVIVANPEVVANYKGGKESALQFLVGQCMRETQGKADPRTIIDLLKQTV